MRKAVGIALAPVWALQVFTGAKSFRANPILGSRALNALGLHVARKALAHGLTAARRAARSPLAPADVRRRFARDGYVLVEDFLPPEQFAAVCAEADALAAGQGLRIQEGDTKTELALIDDEALAHAPALAGLVKGRRFLGLCNYIGARLKHPFCQVQTIRRDFAANESDPQKSTHSDTFHPTLKGWLFLDDVDEARAPFHYVPGSHRLTAKRAAWEYAQSLKARGAADPHVAAGSLRAGPEDLQAMGLPPAIPIVARANTLVLADTMGFHRRGEAQDDRVRRAIYFWMRTNPFNPVLGFRSRTWRKLELTVFKAMRDRAERAKTAKTAA